MLDLEKDVCANQDRGHFMVPQKLSFDESKHVCKKLSGTPLSYTSKADLEAVVHFLSGSSNMRASACIEALEDGSTSVQVWGGGVAREDRVNWTTWNTNQYIEVTTNLQSLIRIFSCLATYYLAFALGRKQTIHRPQLQLSGDQVQVERLWTSKF